MVSDNGSVPFAEIQPYLNVEKLVADISNGEISNRDTLETLAKSFGKGHAVAKAVCKEIGHGHITATEYSGWSAGPEPEDSCHYHDEACTLYCCDRCGEDNICKLDIHNYDKCVCRLCGAIKHRYDPDPCVCSVCGHENHDFDPFHGCNWEYVCDEEYCRRCGQTFPKNLQWT